MKPVFPRRLLGPATLAALLVLAGMQDDTPVPVFTFTGLGNGYASPAVAGERIYVTGERDGTGILFLLDPEGRKIWEMPYGSEWTGKFPGSRSTPAVVDSLVYVSSGMGDIGCFRTDSGKKRWSVNLFRDLHGENPVFGYSVPVVTDGDRLYCIPGGADTNICCLDRFTGRVLWTSPGNGETAGYAGPVVIRLPERVVLVVYTELTLLGLDAATGEILWTYGLSFSGAAPCNDPVWSGGSLYITGLGNGTARLTLSGDGRSITKTWQNEELDTYFGGRVMQGHILFGSSERKRAYLGIDTETGLTVSSLKFGVGAAIVAGDDLVFYNQQGKVGRVDTRAGNMSLIRSFPITQGTNEHFTHPVFSGGLLFIRHGNVLLAYDFARLKGN